MNDDGQKNHHSGVLFTSLCRSLEFCFFALNFVNRKTIKCFSMKLNKHRESFCCYVLVVSTTLKKSFHVVILATTPRAGAQLDAFQRAVIVFTIVLCRRRRRPRCLRFLIPFWDNCLNRHHLTNPISFYLNKFTLSKYFCAANIF